MSEELKAEIDRLKAENAKLKEAAAPPDERVKRANGEARDRRLEVRNLRTEVDALKAERETWKSKADTDHNGLRTQLEAVTGELREVKHRDAFAKAAKAAKVTDPTRLADLLAVSGYKIEGEKPDPAKIGELIKGVLKDRPYLLDPDAAKPDPITREQARQVKRPEAAAAPGADRGTSVSAGGGVPRGDRVPGRL